MRRIWVVFSFMAFSAQADWQYAKFGMTVDQVIAASEGKARAQRSPDQDVQPQGEAPTATALAHAEYSLKGLDFDVFFVFDVKSGGLSLIDLALQKGKGRYCDDILRELRATYGAAETTRRGTVLQQFTWRSETTSNLVRLNAIGQDSCYLMYEPLPRPGGGGL